ncbi:MAG: ABC transporter ATP-binding protein [Clostridium sp.]
MLKIVNFTKQYKNTRKAVDNLNLEVEAGDLFAFIGHNGAGKSTTIKSVVGVLDFNEGEILIDGISIKSDPIKCKSIIGYIPDNPDLYENLTGIQYLNFIADVFKIGEDERTLLIKKYSSEFEISDKLGDLIASYSHGMKQKVAIIGALIHSPKLLILDEPFVGLDPKATFVFKNIMSEFCAKGNSIFFSTHVLDVAEKICNKIAIIKNGKLIRNGKTCEVIGDESLENLFMELIDNESN